MKDQHATSRPEGAFVLLLMQATFWFFAGISALPFVLGGEIYMLLLGAFSFALAGFTVWAGMEVVWRRRWARRAVLALEWICLIGSLMMLGLPIGASRGPVSLLVNSVIPLTVILLLRGKAIRDQFVIPRGVTG